MSLLLKTVALVFFSLAFLYSFQHVFASGIVFCSGTTNHCITGANNCDAGFVPPYSMSSCQQFADVSGSCPISLPCTACGGKDQQCCGSVGSLSCNSGFTPSAPNDLASCTCSAPLPVLTGSHVTAPTTSSSPPGGAGVTCDPNGDGKPDATPVRDHNGIYTALGCVPTEPSQFILAVSRLLSGMGGGIALLLMIAGSFRMITSGGNPDGVKAGSEQFTSALIGLLFIIFAVLLLKIIGVNILNIPGFGPI